MVRQPVLAGFITKFKRALPVAKYRAQQQVICRCDASSLNTSRTDNAYWVPTGAFPFIRESSKNQVRNIFCSVLTE